MFYVSRIVKIGCIRFCDVEARLNSRAEILNATPFRLSIIRRNTITGDQRLTDSTRIDLSRVRKN